MNCLIFKQLLGNGTFCKDQIDPLKKLFHVLHDILLVLVSKPHAPEYNSLLKENDSIFY